MSEEQCLPISNLRDVWQWEEKTSPKWPTTPLQPSTDFCLQGLANSCHIEEQKWKIIPQWPRKSVPKTLLCHDMMGGYLDDKFVNGTQNSNAYRFFHWSGIDTFVYFSHHLITIPPPVWINAAHLHGVQVLGTFITEWKDGENICKEILQSPENIELFVQKLVSISVHHGFDGWLVNIENKIPSETAQLESLVMLVDQLKNAMHSAIPHSLVIWYDSVTSPNGELDWQNELNSKNRVFFDASDGIFLNYTWKEENIIASRKNAGDRFLDVYVGMDVFGRNFYEGGGFNTNKALEVARNHGLSVAIFAPGWVHETLGAENFTVLEYRFWNKLRPHLFFHGPVKLPFMTSFCQGAGLKKFHQGKEISSTPWYNLSLQKYQPTTGSCRHLHSEEEETNSSVGMHGCMETFMNDAFLGGSSLKICEPNTDSKAHPAGKTDIIQRILLCSFFCHGPFIVSLATKKNDIEVNLLLKVRSLKGKYSLFLLQDNENTIIKNSGNYSTFLPVNSAEINKIKEKYDSVEAISYSLGNKIGGDWEMSHYVINRPQVTIVEIGLLLNQTGPVLMGFLSVQELKPMQ